MQSIPFVDLEMPSYIEEEINAAVASVIDSRKFILGDTVERFEDSFAGYCSTRYAIGVSSGTAALHTALLAVGIGEGNSVITVPNTYVATVEAILYTGARVIFVDVEERTGNMDFTKLTDAVDSDTRAILPVHLYGQMANMPEILPIAGRYKLAVIEDACQAHGAAYADPKRFIVARPGVLSAAACFSFYPSKNLGCYGDGGAVVTNSKEIYGSIRMLRNHGQEAKSVHSVLGYNYRLDAIQAAVLSAKLKYLNMWNAARGKIADLYMDLLPPELKPLEMASWTHYHANHLYVVAAESNSVRDRLKSHLEETGIGVGIHYPMPIHLQPAYQHLGYRRGDLPVAESLSGRILSLPMYPGLTEEKINHVCERIKTFFKGGK